MSDAEDVEGHLVRYEYQPLGDAHRETRFIHLVPGQGNSVIKIRLHAQAIDGVSCAQYEALSYTWGSPDDPNEIMVETDNGLRELSVTRNCWVVMHNLRSDISIRTLWIDAVCINQSDLDERGKQMSIMADIYSKALSTVIWLGEASEDTHLAMSWMEQLGRHVTWAPGPELRPTTDGYRWIHEDHARITADEVDAMVDLVSRPWFDRLWVWQEVRLSDPHAIVTCGTAMVPWRSFALAVHSLYGKLSPETPSFRKLCIRLDVLFERLKWDGSSVIGLLNNVRLCRCSDERDRIYATQTVTQTASEKAGGYSREAARVVPDYQSPVSEVYTDFILRYIEAHSDLDFFTAMLERDREARDISTPDDLPSWVPDWSQPRVSNVFHYKGHGYCNISGIYVNRKFLKLKGVRCMKVQSCTRFEYDITMPVPVYDQVRALHDLIEPSLDASFDDERLEILCDVLMAGCYQEAFDRPPSLARSMSTVKSMVRRLQDVVRLPPDTGEIEHEDHRTVMQMVWNCFGRSLFHDDSGGLGLGPAGMRAGDDVVFSPGCPYPIVLRQSCQGRYRFVGCAYVNGYGYVEKLWGALPSTFEPIYTSGPVGRRLGFKNVDTGEITVMDPRVKELRPTWKDPRITTRWYKERDEHTGETRRHLRDMRCTPDELERKGAELQEFTLE